MKTEMLSARVNLIKNLRREARESQDQWKRTLKAANEIESETAQMIAAEAGYKIGQIMQDSEGVRFVISNFNVGSYLYFGDSETEDFTFLVTVSLKRLTKKGTPSTRYSDSEHITLNGNGEVLKNKYRPEIVWQNTGEMYKAPDKP